MRKYFLLGNLIISLFCLNTQAVFGGSVSVGANEEGNTINARLSAGSKLYRSNSLQKFDVGALNLKSSNTSNNSAANMNSAISVTLTDFDNFSAVGKSWLLYENKTASFSMNIGSANASTPQNFVLPTNFLTYFEGAGRGDFIAPTDVPMALRVTGANKVMRSYYYDNNDHPMAVYDDYDLEANVLNHIGSSYDLVTGDDDIFDDGDYEVSDVPLDLNDTFISTSEDRDYITNLKIRKLVTNLTVNGFGTITTPTGTNQCLRMIYSLQTFTRPNESVAYTLVSTDNYISFLSKNGERFKAKISGTSGTVIVSNLEYRTVVSTALLAENKDVKLNNDSKGVTINVDSDTPHPSAILDVKSDSLGILIPRIAKANRPNSPATGLLVYQTDNTPGFYYYDGSGWRILGSSASPLTATAAAPNGGTFEAESRVLAPPSGAGGAGRLVAGSTFIKFDSPREDFENIIIQIQAEGDCNGIFISKKTAEGFEVKELQKGKSNVKFTWKLN